jgi:transposase, IS5 family
MEDPVHQVIICWLGVPTGTIDLGREPVPDDATMCRFRHLLEAHELGRRFFDAVQQHLAAKGLKVATGTIVDAAIR